MRLNDYIKNIPRKARLAAAVIWAFFVAFATHLPNPPGASIACFDYGDKIAHFAMYFILALLLFSVLADKSNGFSVLLIVFFCCAAYGALDEYTQRWADGRNPDFYDWLADATGSVFAMAAVELTRLNARRP